MIDEVKMKRIERRLDELLVVIEGHLEKGTLIPEEVRTERKELTDEYNAMVSEIYQQKTKEFMVEINREINDPAK